ncbi:hypothetical protein FQN57_002722 [Myotisia sp. PD_48]|nr:hypothetical protein FQN57_002722 [Myotisia sp. PD_48]
MLKGLLEHQPLTATRSFRHYLRTISPRKPGCYVPHRCLFSFPSLPQTDHPASRNRNHIHGDGSIHMLKLVHALERRSRTPPSSEIAKGFLDFLAGWSTESVLTARQVNLLLQTFQYLVDNPIQSSSEVLLRFYSLDNFMETIHVLGTAKHEANAAGLVNTLAKSVFREILSILEASVPPSPPPWELLQSYISILASSGSASEALELVESYWSTVLQPASALSWAFVMRGLVKEGRESEISEVIERMKKCGSVLSQSGYEEIIMRLAEDDCIGALKPVSEISIEATDLAKASIIKAAIRNSMIPWAIELSDSLPTYATPETRDALLHLDMARGGDTDSLCRRLDEMSLKNPEIQATMTIETINSLIEGAIATNKVNIVDDLIEMAQKYELELNPQTYLLKIDGQIKDNKIDEATATFQKLEEEFKLDDVNVLVLNKLVKKLCSMKRLEVDFETLQLLVERIQTTNTRFEAPTLRSLCRVLLKHGDLEGVSSILRPVIDSYNPEDLAHISRGLIHYILDMKQSTDSAWEVYELLNMAFPATSTKNRTLIMKRFFERKRSDLACLVFGHMRQKEHKLHRPTASMYAQCLEGIAEAADADSLHLVHNMLKLDLQVELTTEILNSLMLAYASCGMPTQAMEFFKEILHSVEGPSKATLPIFFRVCATYPTGVDEATRMMEKLKTLDIQLLEVAYNEYIGALGGHCELERAVEAIAAMDSTIGIPPSRYTIGALYNSMPYRYWRDQVADWAQIVYPELWKGLEEFGFTENEDGLRSFNIDRTLEI